MTPTAAQEEQGSAIHASIIVTCDSSEPPSHHAAVEVLVHLAEGVGGHLPLAWDDDANISDGQRGVGLALRGPAVGDVDALGGRAADVGRPTRGRGLDDVTSGLQLLLPLVENPGIQRRRLKFWPLGVKFPKIIRGKALLYIRRGDVRMCLSADYSDPRQRRD